MKKILLLALAAGGLQFSAQAVITMPFTGSFTSGSLNGQEILGSIEVNDLGLFSGEALPLPDALGSPAGTVGFLDNLTFTFFTPAPLPFLPPEEVTFNLSNASAPTPGASFYGDAVVGFTYFGTDGATSLSVTYDGTQPEISSALFFAYSDGTSTSLGTLDLPVDVVVPEPSTYAAIAGALALAVTVYRRRKK